MFMFCCRSPSHFFFCLLSFFFNDPATSEIYTLSLHDALPISRHDARRAERIARIRHLQPGHVALERDRKSTRLNSSHANISYAVFCLKKKKKKKNRTHIKKFTEEQYHHLMQ